MFIGHYAVGLAAKRLAPRASLGVLIAAPTLLDLLWPIFILIGWEEVVIQPGATRFTPLEFVSYPISHGLVAVVGWATLFAVIYQMSAHYWRGTIAIWIGVLSHWFLDVATHRPDMPLYAGGPRYGLGLWNHPRATIVVEGLMFLAGIAIYWRSTRPKDRIGEWGFWGFVIALCGFYVANILGPPPPSVRTMALAALFFGWLLVLWAWWFDRHREVPEPS
ncbi:MAG: hypothetical protein ACRD6N_02850 [Pyrinomonadaceae bacterium]